MSTATTAPSPAVTTLVAPPLSYPTVSATCASAAASAKKDDDPYGRLKSLQHLMEFIEM
jgi:hypothetical protein